MEGKPEHDGADDFCTDPPQSYPFADSEAPWQRQKAVELELPLGFWLNLVGGHVARSFERKAAVCGVSISEWLALREIYRWGLMSPVGIGPAIGLTKGAVSKIVARLKDKGGGRDHEHV